MSLLGELGVVLRRRTTFVILLVMVCFTSIYYYTMLPPSKLESTQQPSTSFQPAHPPLISTPQPLRHDHDHDHKSESSPSVTTSTKPDSPPPPSPDDNPYADESPSQTHSQPPPPSTTTKTDSQPPTHGPTTPPQKQQEKEKPAPTWRRPPGPSFEGSDGKEKEHKPPPSRPNQRPGGRPSTSNSSNNKKPTAPPPTPSPTPIPTKPPPIPPSISWDPLVPTPPPNVWPLPFSFKGGKDMATLSPGLFDEVDIYVDSNDGDADADHGEVVDKVFITAAVEVYKNYKFPRFELDSVSDELTPVTSFEISVTPSTFGDVDEAYLLHIDSSRISIFANDKLGVLRALETLSQLIVSRVNYVNEEELFILNTPIDILDKPAFSYRGLLLDTARNYYQVSTIKLILDVMMQLKLNALHWHLTDNQGFSLPATEHAEFHDEHQANTKYYTAEEIEEIVDYAYSRGIRVIPEVDTPGHSKSWSFPYPDLTAGSARCENIPLDVTKPEVYDIIQDLLEEEVELFTDPWIHLGGDEISVECISARPDIEKKLQEIATSNEYEKIFPSLSNSMQRYWVHHWASMRPIFQASAADKTPIIWDEWVDEGRGEKFLGWDPIIETWRGTMNLDDATRKGFRVISAYGWYLNPSSEGCATWEDCYNHNPHVFFHNGQRKQITIADEQKKLVLGGEAAAWEQTEQCFYERVWPRLPAIAERLWSNPPPTNPNRPEYGAYCRDHYGVGPPFGPTTGNGKTELGSRFDNHSLRMFERHNLMEQYQLVFNEDACFCKS